MPLDASLFGKLCIWYSVRRKVIAAIAIGSCRGEGTFRYMAGCIIPSYYYGVHRTRVHGQVRENN